MNFNDYYTESILDTPRVNLDPTVFDLIEGLPPKVHASIKAQIFEDILAFRRIIPINKLYLIGSILTKTYNKSADIDVTIEVNAEDIHPDTGMIGVEAIILTLKKINGSLATGTTHPINYYITTDFNEQNADAIYDLETDVWIKEPSETNFEISNYMSKFENLVSNVDLATGKLKRDIIDYKELEDLDEDSIINFHTILNKKLYEINANIEGLVKFKKDIKDKRQNAFTKPLTPDEIVKYSSKNKLPANVMYKLFQKYYYFDLIQKLDAIISNRDKSNNYIDDIGDALGHKESISFEDFNVVCEKFKKIKSGSYDWSKSSTGKKYKDKRFKLNRSMNNKSLRQVPNKYNRDRKDSFRVLNLASKVVENAKKAPSGIWRLTPMQVEEIAMMYHHIPPDEKDHMKHLGNTGIVVWRKDPKHYYLVKHRGLKNR